MQRMSEAQRRRIRGRCGQMEDNVDEEEEEKEHPSHKS